MNPYIEKLNTYLNEHPPKYGYPSAQSILEMLYFYYTECNPMNTDTIKQGFSKLDRLMSHLTLKENDEVIYTLCDLCVQHERLAFIAGVNVGIRLSSELRSD